jgi:GH24 family phage-related lysozyme (muramidase)/peptidoglycan hydrolase-like protein with peptidoglycan-binding domain/LysM repeat protein
VLLILSYRLCGVLLMNSISALSNVNTNFLASNVADGKTHTVERGDTLSEIAADHGVSVADLMAANPQIKNPDLIYPNDVLNIPEPSERAQNLDTAPVRSSAAPATTATATTSPTALQNVQTMQVSENGKQLVRDSEGFFSKPYNDPAGHATIGYGHLLHRGNVTATDRAKWGTLSEPQARKLLDGDINEVAAQVKSLVKVPVTQGQFDALVSFGFNLGTGKGGLGDSTLLRKLNEGDYAGAQKEFGRWVKATDTNGNLITLPGLVTRRANEAALFGNQAPTGTATNPPATGGTLSGDGSLKQGATGSGVKTLQDDLVKMGFMSRSEVNTGYGTFGAKTEAALKSFQASVGLEQTGAVGPKTKNAIESVIAGVGQNKNADANVITSSQQKLTAGKFLSAADAKAEAGVYGPKTEAAVKAFQAKNNIQQTGVIGPQTFAALSASGGAGSVGGNAPAKNGYVYPLPSQYRTINAADKGGEGEGEFGTSRGGGARSHKGIDIEAPRGTPVSAIKGGTATVLNQPGGAGLYVNVEHSDGTSSQYFHLDTAKAKVGDSFNVTTGQQIGTVGRSGNTPSGGDTHLHFQVRNASGTTVDPQQFFPAFRR